MPGNATVYSLDGRTVDAELLSVLAPEAQVSVGADVMTLTWPDLQVRVSTMEPQRRPEHLQGLQGYMIRQAGSAASIESILATAGATEQVHGVVVEPGFDDDQRAMSLVISLAVTLEPAFIFANGMFYDAFGRVWFGDPAAPPLADVARLQVRKPARATGATATQAARTERMLGILDRFDVPCARQPLPWVPDDVGLELRSPVAVARRAAALHAIVTLARGRDRTEVIGELSRLGLAGELSPAERAAVETWPVDERARQRLIWRVEALVPLLWSLGVVDTLGWPSTPCDADDVHRRVFDWLDGSAPFEGATLRSTEEIVDAVELTVRQHNAVRTCHLEGRPVPANFNWANPTEPVAASRSLAVPLLEQRHHGFNWLIGFGGADWDDVDTPT